MNAMLINLIARYNSIAFTHNYVMGFAYKGNIYAAKTVGLSFGIKLDHASSKNGGGYCLRYQPTKAEKEALVESGQAELICSKEWFQYGYRMESSIISPSIISPSIGFFS